MTHRALPNPCSSCPYRIDVPSGVWAHEEYDKLRDYDAETAEQPPRLFLCHNDGESLCRGWVDVHYHKAEHYRELLSLRIYGDRVDWDSFSDGPSSTPTFESGTAAADHGVRDYVLPSPEALATQEKVLARQRRWNREAQQ